MICLMRIVCGANGNLSCYPKPCSNFKSGMWVKLMRIGVAWRLSCTLPKYTTLRP